MYCYIVNVQLPNGVYLADYIGVYLADCIVAR